MTRTQFEKLVDEQDFDYAIGELYNESNFITDYDNLKEFAKYQLDNDCVGFALHILNAIYNSDSNSDWFYYDFTAGTTCTPKCLSDVDDVENYIGFDEE